MIVLGVDPGLRHTGWAVVKDSGQAAARGTLIPPGHGRIQPHEVLEYVLPRLTDVIERFRPDIVVVEQVTWYGRGRRITLPLAHVAGAIAGMCVGLGLPVYLLLANQKTFTCQKRGWSEHEKDAFVLATEVQRYINALAAGDTSIRRKRSAVGARVITAGRNARG